MNCVKAAMFLGSADPTMDEVFHWGRQGSSRLGLFLGISFFFFLAEVPHLIQRLFHLVILPHYTDIFTEEFDEV